MSYTKGKWECGKDAGIWCGDVKICTMSYPMTFRGGGPIDIAEEECQANARRICHTHNNFDKLLEACKLSEEAENYFGPANVQHEMKRKAAIARQAAIAEAEKE